MDHFVTQQDDSHEMLAKKAASYRGNLLPHQDGCYKEAVIER